MSDDDCHPDGRRKAYVLGYGQPPVSGQFKKGRSGNSHGGPKGRESRSVMIRRIMDTTITGTENGVPVERTLREVIFLRLAERAAKGNRLAIEYLDKYDYPEPEFGDEIPEIRLKLEG